MIVRINHFAAAQAEGCAGWPSLGLQGPIDYTWPADTHAYELLIREQDEQNQPLAAEFRQAQLRQLIPEVLTALVEETQTVVVRLDGPLDADELVAAYKHLSRSGPGELYVVSAMKKLDLRLGSPMGSIRFQASLPHIADLCADAALGLERSVRLRAFCVPAHLSVPLLEVEAPDDAEWWEQLLPAATFMLSTVRSMLSLHVLTRRFGPEELKGRLTQRLLGAG
jgi:hypothetical protein